MSAGISRKRFVSLFVVCFAFALFCSSPVFAENTYGGDFTDDAEEKISKLHPDS